MSDKVTDTKWHVTCNSMIIRQLTGRQANSMEETMRVSLTLAMMLTALIGFKTMAADVQDLQAERNFCPAFAPEELDALASVTSDDWDIIFDEEDDIDIEDRDRDGRRRDRDDRRGRDRDDRWPRRRIEYRCVAENRSCERFYGESRSRYRASREAVQECRRYSRSWDRFSCKTVHCRQVRRGGDRW